MAEFSNLGMSDADTALAPAQAGLTQGLKVKRISVLSALICAAVAVPASAQETTDDWTGAYIGAVGGYESITFDADEEIWGEDAGSESDDGFLFGANLGYDFDTGSAVIGIEAEVTGSQVEESATDIDVVGDELKLEAGRDLYVGARAGFKASDNVLVYAKGGYTNAKAIVSYDDGTEEIFRESDTLDGFRVGAGVETRFDGGFRLRGEYRYADYGEYTYEGETSGISVSKHQFVLGIAYGF